MNDRTPRLTFFIGASGTLTLALCFLVTYLFLRVNPNADWRGPALVAVAQAQAMLGGESIELLAGYFPFGVGRHTARTFLTWAQNSQDGVLWWAWGLLSGTILIITGAALWVFKPAEKVEEHVFIRGTQKIKASK